MKVLIVGGGGREHALAWKAAQSEEVETVYVAPGNPGTALETGVENISIPAGDTEALVDFAGRNHIDLTIVGPEAPLVSGMVDAFSDAGLACFGPSARAAVLEGSKAFSKDFLKRYGIPTAHYGVFTDAGEALSYIEDHGAPIVVKADGLAAGKGVVVARTREEAQAAVMDMLSANKFGDAGHRVVIEEFLTGEEASFIVISDGVNVLPMASSQDHKARDDGDTGPNTGGMGAYSPAPVITPDIHDRIMGEVIEPTIAGMRAEDRTYIGFLYAGVMISPEGTVKVLEFNCRFGDPETQPIMMRLNSDLVMLCQKALAGQLSGIQVEWDTRAALGVVLASAGYPASASKGNKISGLAQSFGEEVKVFHAGTSQRNGDIITAGGRVLCVTALGEDVTHAQKNAYRAIEKIYWEGMFYRHDIGYRAVARETNL